MSDRTKIQWADSTASPWTGCTKRGPSCEHCYAEALAARMGWVKKGQWGKTYHRFKNFEKTARALNRRPWVCWKGHDHPDVVYRTGWGALDEWYCDSCDDYVPVHRRRVFPSLCDPFDPNVPEDWGFEFMDTVREADQVEWLLPTKYPEGWPHVAKHWGGRVPDHVTLGLSAGTQAELDNRIEPFLQIPAKRRFLSLEPLLERITLAVAIEGNHSHVGKPLIDAVIVGGESGPKARPCNIDDVRDVIRQCRAAGVRCYVKQLGSHSGQVWSGTRAGFGTPLAIRDPKGGDPSEWPEDVRVRDKL